ncbi:hypothetical protein QL285_026105 [Trifolium repens]|nr:hypothetical protein QL285_026105 [Trifolium repens]
MAEAWMLAGDFNEIVYPSEKKGGLNASSKKCCKFINRINSCNLLDLGFVGSKFTWRGPIFHGGMRIFERLDRALCNDIWRLEFPEAFVKTLPRLDFSDHHPILICPFGNDPVHVARKFRFESAWQLNDTYNNMLSTCWSDNEHVVTNLQNLQTRIKEWKFNTIDDIVRKKKRLAARIGGDQARIYARNYNYGLKRLEQKLQKELDEVLKHEEVMWFQRSRTKWLVDGDRNTSYYHLKTTNRRRRNNIVMLRNTEGVWVDDPRTLQVMVNKFYQDLFEKPDADWRWYQTNISYPPLEEDHLSRLVEPIRGVEIKEAMFDIHPWKAPGPDGYPAGFYQQGWEIVGNSVTDFISNVEGGKTQEGGVELCFRNLKLFGS